MSSKDKPQFGKNPPSKEELQKIKEILDALEKDPQAYDFLEPVDYIGLGLDDYPSIVKNPMDVSTVRKNIKNNKYPTLQDIFNEIQLIWDNCKLYNMEGSEIYKMAIHCEKLIKRLTDKYFKQATLPTIASKSNKKEKAPAQDSKVDGNANEEEGDDYEVDSGDFLNLQEKILVTEKIRKLSNEGLAALVRLIQKECSSALEDIDNEKLQIRIDSLDRKTFEQINQLIDTLTKVRETNGENIGKKLKAGI